MNDHDRNSLQDEDRPLDPATERVRRKMALMLAASTALMILGLIAVIGAIVYKIRTGHSRVETASAAAPGSVPGPGQGEAAAQGQIPAPALASLDLPAGARIAAMSLDGDHALLNVVTGEGPGTLLFMDLASGKVIRRIELAPQARADPS